MGAGGQGGASAEGCSRAPRSRVQALTWPRRRSMVPALKGRHPFAGRTCHHGRSATPEARGQNPEACSRLPGRRSQVEQWLCLQRAPSAARPERPRRAPRCPAIGIICSLTPPAARGRGGAAMLPPGRGPPRSGDALRPAGKGMCGAAAIRVRHTLAVSKFLMASLQVVAFDMAAEAGRQATCGPAASTYAQHATRGRSPPRRPLRRRARSPSAPLRDALRAGRLSGGSCGC